MYTTDDPTLARADDATDTGAQPYPDASTFAMELRVHGD